MWRSMWALATQLRGWGPRPGHPGCCPTPLRGPHLPERKDQQGQQQEAPQGAAHDDPDGDLRVFLLGDLKRDLQGEGWGRVNRLLSWGPGQAAAWGRAGGQEAAGSWWESCVPFPRKTLQGWAAHSLLSGLRAPCPSTVGP